MSAGPPPIGAAELAVRIQPLAGSVYVALLAPENAIAGLVAEVVSELRALDEGLPAHQLSPASAASLLHELPSVAGGALVVDAGEFVEADWRVLDRRRSDLGREGVTVFVTTPASFDVLMRVAPNFASWLGGQVFTWDEAAGAASPEQIAERLASLRAWGAPMTDAEVIAQAQAGTLPRDPEYAEWLVLLGRGDLVS